jgi:hypothetical protein
MDYDQVEELAELPAEDVLELARSQGLTRARGARLPRPAGLPAGGWYQTRQLRTGGRALIYRYPTNQTDARPHEPCPCGSGKLFGRCCMTTANKTIGRLN